MQTIFESLAFAVAFAALLAGALPVLIVIFNHRAEARQRKR